MDRKTAAIALLIAAVILALLARRGNAITIVEEKAPDVFQIESPSVINYNLPALPDMGGITNHLNPWDWMQTTNLMCGCDAGDFKAQVFQEIFPPPQRPTTQYVFVTPPAINPLPPAPSFTLVNNPPPIGYNPPAASPIYKATMPSYTWGWDGLQRVVILSNGLHLKAGISNRKFTQNNDGTITYQGVTYQQG